VDFVCRQKARLAVVAVDGLRVDGDLDVAGVLAVGFQHLVLGVGVVSVAVLALLLDVLGVRVVDAVLKLVRGICLKKNKVRK